MRMTTHSACINPSIIISKELKRFSHRNTLLKSKRYNVCLFVCMCVCLCACVFVCACCNCNCFMRRRCCSLVALLWTSSLHSICGTSWDGHPPRAPRPTHAHMQTQQRGKGGHSTLQIFATASYTNDKLSPNELFTLWHPVPKLTHTVTLTATAYPQHDVLAGVTLHYPVIALQERAELEQQSGARTVLPLPLSITGGGNTHAQIHGSGRTLWPWETCCQWVPTMSTEV